MSEQLSERPRLVKPALRAPVVTYFQVRSPRTGKQAICRAYASGTGFELRLQDGKQDIFDPELFHGDDAREVMDAYASQLLAELLENGFQQV